MTRIRIQPDAVRRLEEQMRRVSQQLENLAHSLDGALNIPNWSGAHRGRLESEWRGVRSRLTGLSEQGGTLASLMRRAADAFEEVDSHARTRIPGLQAVAAAAAGTLGGVRRGQPGTGVAPASGGVTARALQTQAATVADPVDIRTGRYTYSHTDLILPPGEPLALYRTYSSHMPPGWTFSLLHRLDLSRPDRAVFMAGNGRLGWVFFHRTDAGYVADTPGFRLEEREGAFVLLAPAGSAFHFNPEGQLTAWYDDLGNGVHLEYPDPSTIRLVAPWGTLWGILHLDDHGRPVRAEDAEGHVLRYDYDPRGRLTAFTDRMGRTTRYEYDDAGYLTRIVGPDGLVLAENRYDDLGRILLQKDALGQETRFTYECATQQPHRIEKVTVTYPNGAQVHYTLQQGEVARIEVDGEALRYICDEQGRLTEVHDPNGRVWRLSWDEADRLAALTDPAGQTTRWEYDERGRLLRWTAPDGASIRVAYDDQGHPRRLTGPGEETLALEYDPRGFLLSITDPLGRQVRFTSDDLGRVTETVLPDGSRWTYRYEAGQVVVQGPLGPTLLYRYDPEDHLTGLERAGEALRFTYTPYGELALAEDAEGRALRMEYDPNGRPLRLQFPNGYVLQSTYDPLGRPLEVSDGSGRTLFRQAYDHRGRLIALTDARGRSWRFAYDGLGNPIALTDRKGRTLRFEYDDAYRLARAWDPTGRIVLQMEYDPANRPLRLTDAEGHRMEISWTPSGYPTAISIDGKTARAEWDAAGQVLRLTDEHGRERTYAYDALGRLIRETYPLGQTYTFAYDPAGRLQTQTFPDGTHVSFDYDGLDRPVRVHYLRDGQEQAFALSYSPDGRNLTLRDPLGEVAYALKAGEDVLERRDPWGQVVRYEFSPEGQIRRLVYPDGRAVEYEHDENGNLSRIRDFAGRESLLEYDESDLLTRVRHPNGWVTHYEYDEMDRVVRIRHLNAAGQTVLEQRLTRDGTGRVVETIVSGPIAERVTVAPDALSRRRFRFNELDQIAESDEGSFRYDPNGNLLAYPDDRLQVSLQYDLAGRLTEARVGPDHFSYLYDAEGNRIARTHNGQTRRYVLDTVLGLPRPLVEVDEGEKRARYYIWGEGLQYAVDEQGHLEVYLFNHRGDTLAVVDERGEVVAAYAYSAYGEVVGRYGRRDVPFRFLGRHGVLADHDHLYFIRARYYAPTLGRFTQPDLLRPQVPLPGFLNRYAYALDDPWNLMDVDGRLPTIVIGAAIGGVIGGGMEIFRQVVLEKQPLNQIDWARVGAATIGGVVGGAIASTGIGAIPILGSAISGGVAAGVEQVLNNWFKDRPWHEGVTTAVTRGAVMGAVIDAVFIGAGVAIAGIGARLHGSSAKEAMRQAGHRALIQPWGRVWRSPQAAHRYATDRKFLEAVIAERKVLSRMARDIQWGEEAVKGITGEMVELFLKRQGR